jgi:hypothetical protein
MLHSDVAYAWCALHVVALSIARWMLRNACCICVVAMILTATQLSG